mmetsp:Transcript_27606/g.82271  ORF Transcript_27606/g.82271 Transcript_27606/m.82271 type:complete len:226 (+) Transcript_27606:658-1335(+)
MIRSQSTVPLSFGAVSPAHRSTESVFSSEDCTGGTASSSPSAFFTVCGARRCPGGSISWRLQLPARTTAGKLASSIRMYLTAISASPPSAAPAPTSGSVMRRCSGEQRIVATDHAAQRSSSATGGLASGSSGLGFCATRRKESLSCDRIAALESQLRSCRNGALSATAGVRLSSALASRPKPTCAGYSSAGRLIMGISFSSRAAAGSTKSIHEAFSSMSSSEPSA